VHVNPVHWFLNGKEDTRSSYYLEDAATEFNVQGLGLDWACVTWDGELRFSGSGWSFPMASEASADAISRLVYADLFKVRRANSRTDSELTMATKK